MNNGNMAAVPTRHMHTGSYGHLIALVLTHTLTRTHTHTHTHIHTHTLTHTFTHSSYSLPGQLLGPHSGEEAPVQFVSWLQIGQPKK